MFLNNQISNKMTKLFIVWLLLQVVFALLEFPSTETSYFDNDPGYCDTRADVVETDYLLAVLIGGRTKSKNLFVNLGDSTCHATAVPFLTKMKPDGSKLWLNYYTSPW